MKELTLKCVGCGKTKTFSGDILTIMLAIDASGWRDFSPAPSAMCPECDAQMEDNYGEEE